MVLCRTCPRPPVWPVHPVALPPPAGPRTHCPWRTWEPRCSPRTCTCQCWPRTGAAGSLCSRQTGTTVIQRWDSQKHSIFGGIQFGGNKYQPECKNINSWWCQWIREKCAKIKAKRHSCLFSFWWLLNTKTVAILYFSLTVILKPTARIFLCFCLWK